MKVLFVGSKITSGAGRAMLRIKTAIDVATTKNNYEIEFLLRKPPSLSERESKGLTIVASPEKRGLRRPLSALLGAVSRIVLFALSSISGTGLRSAAIVPTGAGRVITRSEPDVVHFHWLGDATISIQEVAKIELPMVWSLHDIWLTTGSLHVLPQGRSNTGVQAFLGRYFERTLEHKLLELKKKSLAGKRVAFVAPSSWASELARRVFTETNFIHEVIPLPLDISFWRPKNVLASRAALGLDARSPLIGFVASGGLGDKNKGGHIAVQAVCQLRRQPKNRDARLIVAGKKIRLPKKFGSSVEQLGPLSDQELVDFYNSVDVVIAPSYSEAFGQVLTEAQACGTPVIGTSNTGMEDVIDHGRTGFLLQDRNVASIISAIAELFRDPEVRLQMGKSGRQMAEEKWAFSVIGKSWTILYEKVAGR